MRRALLTSMASFFYQWHFPLMFKDAGVTVQGNLEKVYTPAIENSTAYDEQ
ncbi:MAG: hypothetical protein M3040_09595 [Bacteroidota bacterium]|nr:hypothetical protein [Bacteroidota bacterium]